MHAEARQSKQHHRANQEAIESQSEIRNGFDLFAQVDDDNKQGIAQSRGHHESNAAPVDETASTFERE